MNTMTDKKVGLFDELMGKKYPDIAIIQADDAYSTDDLFDYVKYCDKGRLPNCLCMRIRKMTAKNA